MKPAGTRGVWGWGAVNWNSLEIQGSGRGRSLWVWRSKWLWCVLRVSSVNRVCRKLEGSRALWCLLQVYANWELGTSICLSELQGEIRADGSSCQAEICFTGFWGTLNVGFYLSTSPASVCPVRIQPQMSLGDMVRGTAFLRAWDLTEARCDIRYLSQPLKPVSCWHR